MEYNFHFHEGVWIRECACGDKAYDTKQFVCMQCDDVHKYIEYPQLNLPYTKDEFTKLVIQNHLDEPPTEGPVRGSE